MFCNYVKYAHYGGISPFPPPVYEEGVQKKIKGAEREIEEKGKLAKMLLIYQI